MTDLAEDVRDGIFGNDSGELSEAMRDWLAGLKTTEELIRVESERGKGGQISGTFGWDRAGNGIEENPTSA